MSTKEKIINGMCVILSYGKRWVRREEPIPVCCLFEHRWDSLHMYSVHDDWVVVHWPMKKGENKKYTEK